MSLYGMMRTGVSGMAAQANRLSSVADNIANSGTTGYKRSRAVFDVGEGAGMIGRKARERLPAERRADDGGGERLARRSSARE